MVDSRITIISMNCQGLSNKMARSDTFNFLKGKRFSIYLLQDTHFTTREENYIRTQWGFECLFSNFSSQSRGVAILFNNNFEFKIHNIEKDNNGNKLILDMTIQGKHLLLINIYGPNRDDPEFYLQLLDDINKYDLPVILAGDFNLVLDPDNDTVDYQHINNPKARDQVLNLMTDCTLIDVWREMNLEKHHYTWRKKNSSKQSRLDFFLISENLFVDVDESKIIPGYRTDHSIVVLKFNFDKFQKGSSYWKFNNSLLKDSRYIEEVKNTILETKQLYSVGIQLDQIDGNSVAPQDLKFSINDQLFYDVLLMGIRGKTISYASYKKSRKNKKKVSL